METMLFRTSDALVCKAPILHLDEESQQRDRDEEVNMTKSKTCVSLFARPLG